MRIRLRKTKSDYDKAIKTIEEYIEQLESENDDISNKLRDYNKDDEIIKLNEDMNNARKLSLLRLSDKEHESIKQFKQDHWESCKNSGDFEYRITGTGIGSVIKIKCPKCMSVKDVTDVTSW